MVIGHEKQLNMFENMRQNDALAHAYLFTGPAGIGKHAFAKELAFLLQVGEEEFTPRSFSEVGNIAGSNLPSRNFSSL